MDRKLLDYLPPVLQAAAEFQAVNEANEPEIAAAWRGLNRVMRNQFLDTADEQGVAMWERELQAVPKDTDSLTLRKARIRTAWNCRSPYTLPWLWNWMAELCGIDAGRAGVSGYTVNVPLDCNIPNANRMAKEILNMLLAVCPANMRVRLQAVLASSGRASMTGALECHTTVDVYPMEG